MELKLEMNLVMLIMSLSSNRTFMELKLTLLKWQISSQARSNRTFMELKYLSMGNYPQPDV